MFDFYEQSKEMKEFLTHAGLKDLANRIDDLMDNYDFRDISLESFGPLDRGIVVLSIGVKDTIITTQRIDVELASTLRASALNSTSEEELMSLLVFLRKAIIISYNDELKGWIESNISATKLALKQKL